MADIGLPRLASPLVSFHLISPRLASNHLQAQIHCKSAQQPVLRQWPQGHLQQTQYKQQRWRDGGAQSRGWGRVWRCVVVCGGVWWGVEVL